MLNYHHMQDLPGLLKNLLQPYNVQSQLRCTILGKIMLVLQFVQSA